MATKKNKVPHISDIETKLSDSIRNGNTPIASPFLQAKLRISTPQDNDEDNNHIDFFSKSSTIRIIPDDTPTGNDTEPEATFNDLKSEENDTNQKTAAKSMQKIIQSQNKMIDKLMKQLKDRKLDYNQTLKNTINSHEIEVNDLRIEIEKLNEENKKITQLQSLNIQLKNKLSKYDKIMSAKRSKKLPTLPPKPAAVKSKSVPKKKKEKTEKKEEKIEKKPNKINSSIAASLSLKLSKSTDETKNDSKSENKTKSNPKLKKYETMKKIGMPFQSIINKMRMDQCSDELIAEFKGEKVDNNNDSDDDDGPTVDFTDNRFTKYKTMKKINMPHASIINKMRMDGFSTEDIEAFEHEILLGQKKKKKKKDKNSQMTELAIEMGLKPKIKVAPTRVKKLKRIHWTVIELKDIKGTIWEKMAKKHTDQEIGVNAKFELQFQIRQRKPPKTNLRKTRMAGLPNFGASLNDENNTKKSSKKKQTIKWLDSKQDQQIQIGLKKVGLKNEEIYDGIMDMDEKIITLEVLETLFDLLPSKSEQNKTESKIEEIMKNDENDEGLIDYCGPAEMFFIEMSSIPEIKQQMTIWLFCRNFKEIWSHRMQQTTTMLRATQSIKTSKSLHEYLRILLAIGNLMNHGTEKSMAYGFNLDCLKMLNGIKDFSGKKSLAMFVYEFAYNKFPNTHNLHKQLKILKLAVRLETNMIEKSVKEMNDEFHKIDIFSRRLADDYQEGDTAAFREYVAIFVKKQKSNMAVLRTKLKNAKTTARSVAKFYVFTDEVEDVKPEELFKLVQGFIDIMDKAKDALFKLEKERIKMQQKRKKEREKLKKKSIRNKMNKKPPPPSRGLNKGPNKPPTGGIKVRKRKKIINDEVKDDDDDELEDSPLRSHFRKKTQNLEQQRLDLGARLSTTFHEKQAIAKGQMTESLINNHIKQRSIMGNSQHLGDGLFGGKSMDEIAKMAIQTIEHDENGKNRNNKRISLYVPQ